MSPGHDEEETAADGGSGGDDSASMPVDQQAYNRKVIDEFRASGGRLGPPLSGSNMLLLTTIGARTGVSRTTPMMYLSLDGAHGDAVMVIASNMGASHHPGWYHNLVADPAATVELPGRVATAARARTAAGDERSALWARLIEGFPFFTDHQAMAGDREIPLVVLEPTAPDA